MTAIKLETTEAERAEWSACARQHFARGFTHDDRLLDIERRLNRDIATLQAALSEAGKAGGGPVAEKATPTNADLVRAFNAWTPPNVAAPPQDGLREALFAVRVFSVEDDDSLYLRVGEFETHVRANSEAAVHLLKFDAMQRAALAPGEGKGTVERHLTPTERQVFHRALRASTRVVSSAKAETDRIWNEAVEACAKWHEEEIARLDQQIAKNNEYCRQNGEPGGLYSEANRFCAASQNQHRLSAKDVRALRRPAVTSNEGGAS
jgi:hypothetical protein